MKRSQLIAVLVAVAATAALSSPAHARLYMMMHGSNVYPGVATPMPSGPVQPMMAAPMPGRMPMPMAGGFVRPHVGVNVYPAVPTPMPHPDGPNLYQYVRSNPTKFVDPSGLLASYECCTDAQKQTLQQDVNRARNAIIPNLVTSIDAAINADTGDYPLLTATKLGTAKRYLSCINRELDSLGSKCEAPGESRTCNGAIAWANWIFASRIHVCPGYWGLDPTDRSSRLIHEASHKCGSLDMAYFNARNDPPRDVWFTGWQDIGDTYEYWVQYGFCIPGHNCPP